MDDGEPENSRGTAVHHSKQPSNLAESQRSCRVRNGGGKKKMERGKAHTVVRAAHHEDRRPLDLAEGAAGYTAHQRGE
jgi:hypothetical protein